MKVLIHGSRHYFFSVNRFVTILFLTLAACGLAGCKGVQSPVGMDQASTARSYRQTHDNPIGRDTMSRETRELLHRYGQAEQFAQAPDKTLQVMHERAVKTRSRGLLFALAELNYLAAHQVQQVVKPWDARDARNYYLASAVYAWLFLFGDANEPVPSAYDLRFRTACDLYNFGLGWALTGRRSTNAVARLEGGERQLPVGRVELNFKSSQFPWPLEVFDRFLVADQFLVHGLSVRNRQPGLGAPLIGVTYPDATNKLARAVPATVLLRLEGGLAEMTQPGLRGSLELYSPFDSTTVQVEKVQVPLETDTTVSLAYTLNQSYVWRIGRMQFLSDVERIPSGVYPTQPYRPGRIPVVFVHGTFSSPVTWAEMFNTLMADPELRQRYQFWYFIYNSGNPTIYSGNRLRAALTEKLAQLDPEGRDAALRQMVVIGHSQGGLVTKLTATDTGDQLLRVLVKTNQAGQLQIPAGKEAALRKYACVSALPFVKRVIFISTPHRGSYGATGLAQNLARRIISLPTSILRQTTDLAGLTENLSLPKEVLGSPTSVDSMSPKNPMLLTLADIPVAPGIKAHSIVAVKGDGDYQEGKDGLVAYHSAHVDYAESELVVRSKHSCQNKPEAIEEVRRILHEHLATLPAYRPDSAREK